MGRPFRRNPSGLDAQLDLLNVKFTSALRSVVSFYEEHGIDYALVGGMAFGCYAEPRTTRDLDFVLGSNAFEVRGPLVIPRTPFEAHGIQIDSLAAAIDDPVIAEGMTLANRFGSSAGIVNVLPVEYLAYMKLHSTRSRDLNDVSVLIELAEFNDELFFDLVDRSSDHRAKDRLNSIASDPI